MLDKCRMIDSGIEFVGDIPQSWFVFPAGGVFSEVKEKNTKNEYNNAFSFRYGEIVNKKTNGIDDGSADESISAYRVVSPNTIMINGLNLNYDFVTQRVAIVKDKGIITSAYLAVQPDESRIVPKFALYLFKAYDAKQVFHGMGSGVRKTLKYSDFKHIKIVAPSMDEQKSIVAYLDCKMQEIDSLIAEAKASIEEYKAWKASIIYEAVTKGLDPDAEMKGSGIEWIGEIPNNWLCGRLGCFTEMIQTGPFGSQLHSDDYVENGLPVINPANIKNGNIYPNEKACISREMAAELSQHILSVGDIIMGRRGEMGRCACVREAKTSYFCGTGCVRIRCNTKLNPEYISYYLQMPTIKQYLELHSVGTTMANLNAGIISSIPILCPPVSEQVMIVKHLKQQCMMMDALVGEKESLIADLETYKKSLIFEVVTGKRKVV